MGGFLVAPVGVIEGSALAEVFQRDRARAKYYKGGLIRLE